MLGVVLIIGLAALVFLWWIAVNAHASHGALNEIKKDIRQIRETLGKR